MQTTSSSGFPGAFWWFLKPPLRSPPHVHAHCGFGGPTLRLPTEPASACDPHLFPRPPEGCFWCPGPPGARTPPSDPARPHPACPARLCASLSKVALSFPATLLGGFGLVLSSLRGVKGRTGELTERAAPGKGSGDRVPRSARPSRPPLRPPRPESVGSRGGCSWRPRPRTPARLQLRLRSGSREAEGTRCDSPPRPLPASVSPRVRRRRRRQRLPSARLPLDRATASRAPLPSLARRLPCSGRQPQLHTPTHWGPPGSLSRVGSRLGCRGPSRGARGVCRCSEHPDFAWVQPLDLSPSYSLLLALCRASSQATLILSKGHHLFACLGRRKVRFNTEHLLGVDRKILRSPPRSSEVQGSLRRTNPQGGDGPPCLISVFFSTRTEQKGGKDI